MSASLSIRKLGVLVLVVAVLMPVLSLQVDTASAGTPSNLQVLYYGWNGDNWSDNYDSYLGIYSGSDDYDWPLTMFFWGNATESKVRSELTPTYPTHYGLKYLELSDRWGYGWWVDDDGGNKNPSGTCPTNIHVRIYVDSAYGYNWSQEDGTFVLGSTHYDVEEGSGCPEWFGLSGSAEANFANYFDYTRGLMTWRNQWDFSNYESPHWDATQAGHFWSNDGYATAVYIP
ncbi:MAG: hypothetical protein ABI658_23615 [Acidimicrobiales bacterium]